jgi:5-methylcytosine-specific restriction protein A
VGLADITKEAVLAAIAECDQAGPAAFLEHYKFGKARRYLLLHEGREYDSKAIVGVAHRYLPGREALRASEFSGGKDDAAAGRLSQLGFTISVKAGQRDPAWTYDELVLACDLVALNEWRELPVEDPRVVDLSDLLQRLTDHPLSVRGPRFRSLDSVRRKMADISTRHPHSRRQPTNGGKLDVLVMHEFIERPEEMHAHAELIRTGVRSNAFADVPDKSEPGLDDGDGVREGGVLARRHLARERNPKLRRRKINDVLRRLGYLACEVCGFDFERTYGDRGTGYAECHHVVPLHVSGATTTRLRDLVILCANCHRMIHRGSQWLTPAELREIVQSLA